MKVLSYFSNLESWSVLWLLGLLLIFSLYLWMVKSTLRQILCFAFALCLSYLVFGSPLNAIKAYGLHSIGMVQQVLALMVIPVLILISIPKRSLKKGRANLIRLPNLSHYYLLTWVIGTLSMWGGHYLTAAILSSRTGLTICGLRVAASAGLGKIPDNLVLLVLFLMGVLFVLPLFHPEPNKRIEPLQQVVYLFTSCFNCTILGLYVVFSASSASVPPGVQSLAYLTGSLPWTPHIDQELAGLIMWVPGCLLYVLASMGILLVWYGEGEAAVRQMPE